MWEKYYRWLRNFGILFLVRGSCLPKIDHITTDLTIQSPDIDIGYYCCQINDLLYNGVFRSSVWYLNYNYLSWKTLHIIKQTAITLIFSSIYSVPSSSSLSYMPSTSKLKVLIHSLCWNILCHVHYLSLIITNKFHPISHPMRHLQAITVLQYWYEVW